MWFVNTTLQYRRHQQKDWGRDSAGQDQKEWLRRVMDRSLSQQKSFRGKTIRWTDKMERAATPSKPKIGRDKERRRTCTKLLVKNGIACVLFHRDCSQRSVLIFSKRLIAIRLILIVSFCSCLFFYNRFLHMKGFFVVSLK